MQKYSLSHLLPTLVPFILIASLNILSPGCSGSRETDGTSFVIGQIQMVSNEPFAKLAVINDTSLYLLDCNEEVHEMLYDNQGKSAKIYYSSIYRNEEGIKVLKALKAEILAAQDSK